MADRNPILKPANSADVQFSPQVLDQKINNAVSTIPTTTGVTSTTVQGTIVTYSITTNQGTANLVTGPTATFTNGTGVYLVANDVVLFSVDTAGTYIAVAIISRANKINTIAVPPVTLDVNYPITTSSLIDPIQVYQTAHQKSLMAYDITGNHGLGTDLVIGPSSLSGTSVNNGLDTINGINYGFGNILMYDKYLRSDGYLIGSSATNPANTTLYYKATYSDTVHTIVSASANYPTYDYTNGNLIYYNNTIPYTRIIANGSVTPITAVTTAFLGNGILCADHGYAYNYNAANIFRKTTSGTDDWVNICPVTTNYSSFHAGGPNGELYKATTGGTGPYIYIQKIFNNTTTSYNTGILATPTTVYGLRVSSSNVVYMLLKTTADYFGLGTTSQYSIGVFGCVINTGTPTAPSIAPTTMVHTTGQVGLATLFYAGSLQPVGSSSLFYAVKDGVGIHKIVKFSI